MFEDVLLVLRLDVLVVDGLLRLRVDPADVQLAILQAAIDVLDVSHEPGHLNAALDREFATGLHLPAGTRTSPWPDLGKASDNNDALEVEHALKLRQVLQALSSLDLREVEFEVRARRDGDGLHDALNLTAVLDLEVGSVVLGNSATQVALLRDGLANASRDLCEVGNAIHATAEVGPDWLDLSDAEEKRVHESEQVERHLLRAEGTHAVSLDLLRDHVCGAHETCAAAPARK